MLVGVNQVFQVGDHDFSRCSLTPSVSLNVKVPLEVTGPWYSGKVYVCLKDSVFEPSSPSRHALELERMLPHKPILMLYTDGGPDHRCTYLSVMVSCIYLWHKMDLDCLILARTPPGSSWKNPAERVMSLLNLGLQSIGVMRAEADEPFETRIKRYAAMRRDSIYLIV